MSQNFKKQKSNGINSGFKNPKRKSEEHLIWYKKVINVLSKNVEEIMAQMFLSIYTWNSNIKVALKPKGKL